MKKQDKVMLGTGDGLSREIKFRVIYKGEKKVSECRGIYWDTKKALCFISGCRERREYKKVMQYTGLKDKNGVEIYEGDLVKYKGNSRTREVYYDDERLQFRIRCKSIQGDYSDYSFSHGLQLNVIGNIFEHPHLLEAQHETTSS